MRRAVVGLAVMALGLAACGGASATSPGGGSGGSSSPLPSQMPVVAHLAAHGGNLYALVGCQVWRIDPSNKSYTVVAGKSTCGYSGDRGPARKAGLAVNPWGLAVGQKGNVFIGDGSAIREVSVSTGKITKILGASAPTGHGAAINTSGPTPGRGAALAMGPTGELLFMGRYKSFSGLMTVSIQQHKVLHLLVKSPQLDFANDPVMVGSSE
ncbi:MAG: hypothetical protein ACRD0J_09445, partial [Acidimicrobiales bacterium]